MQGAISRSVMRDYPSTTDPNSYPHIPYNTLNTSHINPTLQTQTQTQTQTHNELETSDSLNTYEIETVDSLSTASQISQVPFTQACGILSNRSKVVAQVSFNTKTHSTTSTKTHNTKTTNIPTLSHELSAEFDTSWSGDDEESNTVTVVCPSESLSQLRRDATNALRDEDIRAEQVKYAIDHPITTLAGLNQLRETRKREAKASIKPFSTYNTVKNHLEPEKSKLSTKSPKNTKRPTLSRKKVLKTKQNPK